MSVTQIFVESLMRFFICFRRCWRSSRWICLFYQWRYVQEDKKSIQSEKECSVDCCVFDNVCPQNCKLFAWVKRFSLKYNWDKNGNIIESCHKYSISFKEIFEAIFESAWSKCWPNIKVHVFWEWIEVIRFKMVLG